jgi:ribosomal protein L39E|tara:strand:+ start:265 stop:675 length:411 start_codon:yes stop_codon:yes gene_type:complete
MSRGRPVENVEIKRKYKLVFHEFPSKPELGETSTWHFDLDKAPNGPYKVEFTYPKGFKPPKVKIEKNRSYSKAPVVMVFKTSNRSNAKTKMKVWRNTNIDYINSAAKLPGVPEKAVILHLSIGESFIEKYKQEYSL